MDGEIPRVENDPFYSEQNFSLDFFLRLRAFQQKLFAHDGYRAVLGAFGPNLLFKTGSRPVKRQGEHTSDRGNPARMRAIPNNAILQQFGYVANVVAGLGTAVGSDLDRFNKLAKSSKRLQSLLSMIAHAKTISSLNAMAANAKVFDPAGPPLFTVKRGRAVTLAIRNSSSHPHVMHLHGHSFRVLDRLDDGWKPFWMDTLVVGDQIERIAFVADNPGKWLIECAALERQDGGMAVWFAVN